MFSKSVQNLLYNFNIRFVPVFDIDQNIIQIYNNKNIKFFYKNLVNISLKRSQHIRLTKKYDLILLMSILCLENYFVFITFPSFYLIIDICQV